MTMKCPFAKYIVSINSLKLSCFLVLSHFGLNPRRIHFTKVMNLIWLSVNGIYSSASLFSRDLISNIFIPISVLWMSSPLNNIFLVQFEFCFLSDLFVCSMHLDNKRIQQEIDFANVNKFCTFKNENRG